MSNLYADRGKIFFNGQEMADIQSVSVTMNSNTKLVQTMSKNGRAAGFVRGNLDGNLSFSLAQQAQSAAPFFLNTTFLGTDQITVQFFGYGADDAASTQIILTGVCLASDTRDATSQGSESQAKYNFIFVDATDPIGVSAQLGGIVQ